jgi:hypothetical protein
LRGAATGYAVYGIAPEDILLFRRPLVGVSARNVLRRSRSVEHSVPDVIIRNLRAASASWRALLTSATLDLGLPHPARRSGSRLW